MATTSSSTSHPGSDYYVSETGTIQAQANPVLAALLKSSGWSGPYTWAQAKATANDVPGRIVKGEAGAVAAGSTGGASTAATAADNAASGWSVDWSGAKNFIIRAVEVSAGVILILIALVKMTGADKTLTGYAKQVVSKAPLL